ncbi:MAG: MarR family transcriptional regulator [Opitutaceae bacterium]|nr:MarR family transcriptional regulator [Opitutaceae bacterium]
MGTRWGINRTVAQVHALLYLSPDPLPADEITTLLGVARSNVSTSLKELQGWGIVRLVHVMGDKRDHFESLHDVWEMFRIILDERKRREIDPTREMLRATLNASAEEGLDEFTRMRIQELSDFMETSMAWYTQVSRWPQSVLTRFLRLGDQVLSLLKGGRG